MKVLIYALAGLATAVAFAMTAPPARAQTAGDINRLNAAIQICNSPMGAGMAECAKLRGKLGIGAPSSGGLSAGGLGGLVGGGKAGAAAGILGAIGQARAAATPAAPAAAMNATAIQDAIRMCVQNAGGNNAAIQACLQIANAGRTSTPPAPGLGIAAYQAPAGLPAPHNAAAGLGIAGYQSQAGVPASLNSGNVAAAATYRAGQGYQACVAANPNNWQSCVSLLNGGAPR